jgi:hypothetical protein
MLDPSPLSLGNVLGRVTLGLKMTPFTIITNPLELTKKNGSFSEAVMRCKYRGRISQLFYVRFSLSNKKPIVENV